MLSWWKMGVTKTRHLGHLKIIKESVECHKNMPKMMKSPVSNTVSGFNP
jgi:hypothetical protein